jgi:AcrR family transcriptional regulator
MTPALRSGRRAAFPITPKNVKKHPDFAPGSPWCPNLSTIHKVRVLDVEGLTVWGYARISMKLPMKISMKPPMKAGQTRQRILDAAAAWFRNKGLAFTSMADLAKFIGVKTSSLYYHFESKDALIEETLRIGIELVHNEVREAVESLGPGATHRERIRAAILAHVRTILGDNDYSSANIINYSHAPVNVRQKNREVRAAYGRYWASLLEAAQRDGAIAKDMDLSIVRLLLIGALNWTVEWYSPNGKTPDEIGDQCSRMFFDGVGPGPVRPHETAEQAIRNDTPI